MGQEACFMVEPQMLIKMVGLTKSKLIGSVQVERIESGIHADKEDHGMRVTHIKIKVPFFGGSKREVTL
jgi:hypothetical protein